MSFNRRIITGSVAPLLGLGLAVAGCADPKGDAVPQSSAVPSSSGTPSSSGGPEGARPSAEPSGPSDPASPAGPPASTRPPLSNPVPPTMGPADKPPKDPTDRIPADTIGGWITRGGSGPCYGLVDDDGVEYALHGTGAGALAVGTRVVATIGPASADVDCGPGRPVQLRSVRRLT